MDFGNKHKCVLCGKQAKRLCDIVIGVHQWVGHPSLGIDEPREQNITCDNPICSKCSKQLNEHMDICPECFKKIKSLAV